MRLTDTDLRDLKLRAEKSLMLEEGQDILVKPEVVMALVELDLDAEIIEARNEELERMLEDMTFERDELKEEVSALELELLDLTDDGEEEVA